VSPSALYVVTLIVEARAIDVDQRLEWRVDFSKGSVLGRDAGVEIHRLQVVLEAGEVVSPVRSGLQRQVETREKIVLPGTRA